MRALRKESATIKNGKMKSPTMIFTIFTDENIIKYEKI